MQDIYIVIGGSGFIGRHIVQKLLDRGDTVHCLDIVQRYDDVPFYNADISQKDQLVEALKKSGATCIIHTASPEAQKAKREIFWKVNVDGTNAVIAAATEVGVRKLVYTSSSGVVFNGADVIKVDETAPFPTKPMDVYMETKAIAEEAILSASGKQGLLTAAIRPSNVFGPGDHWMKALYGVYERGETRFQIGNNKNLNDYTYVGNVADAHILAADKLESSPGVAGEVFFITNDDPRPFWDFPNKIWDSLDLMYPGKRVKKSPIVIPRFLGHVLATCAEWVAWLRGKESTFTRFNVTFMCAFRTHKIEKAKRVLGYVPKVRVDEGIEMMFDMTGEALEEWKIDPEVIYGMSLFDSSQGSLEETSQESMSKCSHS